MHGTIAAEPTQTAAPVAPPDVSHTHIRCPKTHSNITLFCGDDQNTEHSYGQNFYAVVGIISLPWEMRKHIPDDYRVGQPTKVTFETPSATYAITGDNLSAVDIVNADIWIRAIEKNGIKIVDRAALNK